MSPLSILQILANLKVYTLVKWMFVLGMLMYSAFSVVIIRQTSVMSETLKSPVNAVVKILAWLHLIMSILLLWAAIAIL